MSFVSAGFSGVNFPSDVPIGVNYNFEATYNDTSVEKCYFAVHDVYDRLIKYYQPVSKVCRPDNVCEPAKLYLNPDGSIKFSFDIDMSTFQPDSTYYFIVSCGTESYNATVTTRTMDMPYWFVNLELYLLDKIETASFFYLVFVVIIIMILVYVIFNLLKLLFRKLK